MAAATPTVPEEGPAPKAPSPNQMMLKRQHSAIPEGENEDGEEEEDMPFPDDDETAVRVVKHPFSAALRLFRCLVIFPFPASFFPFFYVSIGCDGDSGR